ncbi:hypothetical protein [Candidatus Methanomassiliicoccus intestinalis]|uniref:hypothetical protein n=1 Tax=Candidatus Methanomassiliicoccus intestinalis TaxID=1406512 RepID=UPI0037DC140C
MKTKKKTDEPLFDRIYNFSTSFVATIILGLAFTVLGLASILAPRLGLIAEGSFPELWIIAGGGIGTLIGALIWQKPGVKKLRSLRNENLKLDERRKMIMGKSAFAAMILMVGTMLIIMIVCYAYAFLDMYRPLSLYLSLIMSALALLHVFGYLFFFEHYRYKC